MLTPGSNSNSRDLVSSSDLWGYCMYKYKPTPRHAHIFFQSKATIWWVWIKTNESFHLFDKDLQELIPKRNSYNNTVVFRMGER